MNKPNLWLAIICAVVALSLATCSAGVFEAEGVPRGELGSAVMAVIFVCAAIFFYRRRNLPLS